MKIKFILLFGLVLFCFVVTAQESKEALYKRKVDSYISLSRTGFGLSAGGAASILGGTVLIVRGIQLESAYYNNQYYNQYSSYGSSYNAGSTYISIGIPLIELGVASLATGIVLHSIGTRKARQYKSLLDKVDVSVSLLPKNKYIGITYRF